MRLIIRFGRPLAVAGLLALSVPAVAQVLPAPGVINFQGKLTNASGAPVPDGGNYTVTISLWDAATGGNQKWSQTLSNVTVKGGVFSALLTADTAGLFNGTNLWLQTQVAGDPAMAPRQQVASVPFALKANTVPDGSVGSAQLAHDIASLSRVSGDRMFVYGSAIGFGTQTPSERVTVNGRLAFQQNGGDHVDSAKLDYRGFDPNSLSIVGAGTTTSNRNVRLWDTLSIGYSAPSSGVAAFNGNVGIGTDAPHYRLSLGSDNAFTKLAVWDGGTSDMGFGVGTGQFRIHIPDSSNRFSFLDAPDGNELVTIQGSGRVGIGTTSPSTALDVNGEITAQVVTVLGGSDVAEPYHVEEAAGVKPVPGMVVVMDSEHVGQMKVASRAYDPAVGGILSGANGVNPGLTLRQKGTVADGELPVASVGRVWCYADADANGPITTGTLLTTSDTPGYAMRVNDFDGANGCIIGKAMSSLASGKGLVLVLVSLK